MFDLRPNFKYLWPLQWRLYLLTAGLYDEPITPLVLQDKGHIKSTAASWPTLPRTLERETHTCTHIQNRQMDDRTQRTESKMPYIILLDNFTGPILKRAAQQKKWSTALSFILPTPTTPRFPPTLWSTTVRAILCWFSGWEDGNRCLRERYRTEGEGQARKRGRERENDREKRTEEGRGGGGAEIEGSNSKRQWKNRRETWNQRGQRKRLKEVRKEGILSRLKYLRACMPPLRIGVLM